MNECFLVDKESLTLIDDDFELLIVTVILDKKTSVSLRDYINWTTDINKKNSEKKYFNIQFFSL